MPGVVKVDPHVERARGRVDHAVHGLDACLQFTGKGLFGNDDNRRAGLHLREQVLAVRPGITDPASLEHLDEAAQLAVAADPEREYVERILPKKLALQAAYAARATLWSDLGVILRTVRLLIAR